MSKITVGIESDALDLIIHQTLVEDYRSLCDEVRRLEKKVELRTFEQEDLVSTRKWRDGLEAMLSYYLMPDKAQEIIDGESLNAEAARRYMTTSRKREFASDNGTELNALLPKMSPLNPQYLTKKQSVFQKISAFVEKFKGVGGEI